jgi:formylglycine-generating enzyme required for sulfatase activity
MVAIAAGVYTPLFRNSSDGDTIAVEAFYLDVYAVTNAQYLAFVTAHPRWQRPRVPRLFADQSYLQHWQGDGAHAAPATEALQSPVTNVSWFAAKAYCQWVQKRLPRVAEWEYVALASADAPDGRTDPGYLRRILEWYAVPSPPVPPAIGSGGQNYWGVYDMHGVIWEWVADFNTALVTGESRGESDFERNLYCGAGATGVAEAERINYPAFMRYAYRSSLQGHYTVNNLGFRCARDAP